MYTLYNPPPKQHQQLYEVTLQQELQLAPTKSVVEALAGVLVPRKRWGEAERVVNRWVGR